jgi:hypothetical protein
MMNHDKTKESQTVRLFFNPWSHLGRKRRKLLDEFWAGLFREHILEELPVDELLCGIGQMREFTGLSLCAGTLMLARKQLLTEEGGVYAPEACLQPQVFVEFMKAKGLKAFRDIEMTEPL